MEDLKMFAAELIPGLVDAGTVRVEWAGPVPAVFIRASEDGGEPKEYRFAESLGEIAAAIIIDEAIWRSTWPDWSLTAASIAMFSVHVQEAIATAPAGASILRLVSGGVIAVQQRTCQRRQYVGISSRGWAGRRLGRAR
ncbi:hypothetical protein [Arthrobacter sp. ISL-65]|uniref:hypothetical protein n=1 Tax=Arthrobacter sp. ISL-65 TaxID=2819112 RepID=UPI001BE62A77|nr:hypothetical protein [Arthrobacter sp. ISL-65]MBT2550861.1 hypothetical protein [Arthrobacter sp. ISL-65]